MHEYYAMYKVKHDREDAARHQRQQELIEAAAEPKPRRRWWRLSIRLRLPSIKATEPAKPCPDTILSAR